MRSLLYHPSVRYSLFNDNIEPEVPTPFKEKEDAYVAHFHFPGLKKDAVNVSVHEDAVKVTAQSPEDAIVSIDYNKSFLLAEGTNLEELTAKLEDGILTITVPKQEVEESVERVIEIS